jgi:hypothetical protein
VGKARSKGAQGDVHSWMPSESSFSCFSFFSSFLRSRFCNQLSVGT